MAQRFERSGRVTEIKVWRLANCESAQDCPGVLQTTRPGNPRAGLLCDHDALETSAVGRSLLGESWLVVSS